MLFINILLSFLMLITGGSMPNTQINNYFNQAVEINIYKDNQMYSFKTGEDIFDKILSKINDICEGSIEMPAYGVSLDSDTINAMKKGLWIELDFKKTLTHNDMPFERLLVEINDEFTGINIIRRHDGLYEGRCFYLNLSKPIKI